MAIGSVVERGPMIYVYDEKGRQLTAVSAGNNSQDGLQGYSGSSFSVRRGQLIYVYDEKGRQLSVVNAR